MLLLCKNRATYFICATNARWAGSHQQQMKVWLQLLAWVGNTSTRKGLLVGTTEIQAASTSLCSLSQSHYSENIHLLLFSFANVFCCSKGLRTLLLKGSTAGEFIVLHEFPLVSLLKQSIRCRKCKQLQQAWCKVCIYLSAAFLPPSKANCNFSVLLITETKLASVWGFRAFSEVSSFLDPWASSRT